MEYQELTTDLPTKKRLRSHDEISCDVLGNAAENWGHGDKIGPYDVGKLC
jgi:hypothetical protein